MKKNSLVKPSPILVKLLGKTKALQYEKKVRKFRVEGKNSQSAALLAAKAVVRPKTRGKRVSRL